MTDSTVESVEELANACVVAVRNSIGFELDFTPETLPVLDHYLRQAETQEPEVATLAAAMAGAYYGEVVRRTQPGARWRVGPRHELWRLEFEGFFLYFNPIGVALEALLGRPAEGWSASLEMSKEDQQVVHDALERLGGIDEEDYYRLAIRHEVLELACSTLSALASARGETITLGPEVYAAAVVAAESAKLD